MRRGRLLIIATALVAITVAPRLVGAEPSDVATAAAVPRVLPTTGSAIAPTELDRVIAVVAARLTEHDTYLDVRTLGELHLARARRDEDLADYEDAVRLLGEAHDRDRDDPDAATPLAAALVGVHRFAEAAGLASEVLASHPDNLTAWAVAADAALATGASATASAALAQLAGFFPDDPSVALRRSELAWQTGDLAGSRLLSAEAVDLARTVGLDGPDLALYLTYDAHRALDADDHAAARTGLDEALAIAPDDAAALAESGRLLAALGDLEAAEAAYRRSTDLRPDPVTLVALGEVRTALGDATGAGHAFATVEAVAALAAGDEVYRSALARFNADHGDPDLAVELAMEEADGRGDPATLQTLGRALAATGRFDEARSALDQAIAWGLPDARLLYQSGVVWAALGDTERARSDLEAALAVDDRFRPVEAPGAERLLAELP